MPPWFVSACIALLFVTLISLFTSYRGVFEFDPDEANNLVKALLLEQGFSLGKDIWTDQPPLFSYVLQGLFKLTGGTVASARSLTLFFSGLLLFGLQESLRRSVGQLAALGALSLLLTSTLYVPLSVSVMIGLPSLAFMVLAFWACTQAASLPRAMPRGRQQAALWFFVSGLLAGCSLGTKLFTAFLLPLFAVLLLTRGRLLRAEGGPEAGGALWTWRETCLFAVAWGVGWGGALLVSFAPLLLHGEWSGLVEAHAGSRGSRPGAWDGWPTLRNFLREDPLLYLGALLGLGVLLFRRVGAGFFWGAWLLFALVSLIDHYPVWPHHRLLLSVPAAALTAFAFQALLEQWERWSAARLGSGVRLLSVGLLSLLPALSVLLLSEGRLEHVRHPPRWSKQEQDWAIYQEFDRYAHKAEWVASSRGMHAFRSGRSVPPDLGVTSWKRFRQKLLSSERVVEQLATYEPEVVLISSRWPSSVRAAVRKHLRKTHCRVNKWEHQTTELWVDKPFLQEHWASSLMGPLRHCR